jgi:putative MATE family efflux protein
LSENQLTQGNVRTALIRFALPFLGASLIQFLYGAVDLIIVGRFGDAAGVSAVATGSQLMQTLTGLISGFAAGGTVLIGQYTGARREDDVKATIGTMFALFAAAAAAATVVLTLATGAMVSVMRVPDEAILPARQYIFTCCCGLLFITGYNVICGMLRGMGDSRRPMIFVAISCCVNIVGDLLLVGPLHMGALGAAIATVFAQAISMCLALTVLFRGEYARFFTGRWFRIRRDKVGFLLRLGTPMAMQDFLVSLSFLLITAIVNGIGLDQSAAVGVVERIIGFGMLVPIAFMSAISAMTAQNIGAGRQDRAISAMKYGLVYSLIFGVLILAALQIFPQFAMGLFIDDPAVIGHGALYLRTYSIDCLLVCVVFCFNGFFSGCGRTGFTLANSLISTFTVRVPMVWLMSRMAGVTLLQIGLAAPLASLLQIIMQLCYMKWGGWRKAVIT